MNLKDSGWGLNFHVVEVVAAMKVEVEEEEEEGEEATSQVIAAEALHLDDLTSVCVLLVSHQQEAGKISYCFCTF